MAHPNKGKVHRRTLDKIQFAVRLMVGCPQLSMGQIAQMIGVSVSRLSILQRSPLWIKVHTQYVNGVITQLDDKTEANYELAKKNLDFAVPLAMQTLVQQALNAKDERVKNKACNDILDRDGTFVKVSRTKVEVEEKPAGSDKDNQEAAELIAALNSAKVTTIN